MLRRAHWFAMLLAVSALLGIAAAAAGDDRASAEVIVQGLERDEAHKAVTADSVRRARAAMERATRMRGSNDEVHARLADGLALTWAETARDLAKAADVEKQAADARRDALDAGAHAERERALLEEGIARTGRLRAELDAVEREAKEGPERTSAQGASLDAGTTPPPSSRRRVRADGDPGASPRDAGTPARADAGVP